MYIECYLSKCTLALYTNTDNEIDGTIFQHIDEDTWRDFGMSQVGLIRLEVRRKGYCSVRKFAFLCRS